MKECSSCGAPVSAGQRSCPECGASLSQPTESFAPVSAAPIDIAALSGADDGPVLIVRKGPQPGERFYIDREHLSIGRDPLSDIFLNDMTVSREHAVVESIGGEVRVRDAGSLNGTYLNGVVVALAPLSDGDVLQIGTFQMVFVDRSGGAAR